MEIKQIKQTSNNQLFVYIPKKTELKAGDYVKIIKVEE